MAKKCKKNRYDDGGFTSSLQMKDISIPNNFGLGIKDTTAELAKVDMSGLKPVDVSNNTPQKKGMSPQEKQTLASAGTAALSGLTTGLSGLSSLGADTTEYQNKIDATKGRIGASTLDELMAEQASIGDLGIVTAKDLGAKSFKDMAMGFAQNGIQGVASGASAGPWGMLASAGTSQLIGLATDLLGNAKKKRQAAELTKQNIIANIDRAHNLAERGEAIGIDNANLAIANYSALGGNIATHGADFFSGLREFNAGGSHEQNPYEGVQIGVDPQGVPNLVEEGETMFNNYVFSARIELPEELKREFKLGGNIKTFADASKKISEEMKETPNDPISKRTQKALLTKLQQAQEMLKNQMQQEEAINQMILQGQGFAYGGNLFAPGGATEQSTDQNLSNLDLIKQNWLNHIINAENAAKKGYDSKTGRWTKVRTSKQDANGKIIPGNDYEVMGMEFKNNKELAKLYNSQGYLTNEQVSQALIDRMQKDYINARDVFDTNYGKGQFDKLPYQSQMVLTDIGYNTGSIKKFKALQKALYEGDYATAMKNVRSGNDRRADIRKDLLAPLFNTSNTKKIYELPERSFRGGDANIRVPFLPQEIEFDYGQFSPQQIELPQVDIVPIQPLGEYLSNFDESVYFGGLQQYLQGEQYACGGKVNKYAEAGEVKKFNNPFAPYTFPLGQKQPMSLDLQQPQLSMPFYNSNMSFVDINPTSNEFKVPSLAPMPTPQKPQANTYTEPTKPTNTDNNGNLGSDTKPTWLRGLSFPFDVTSLVLSSLPADHSNADKIAEEARRAGEYDMVQGDAVGNYLQNNPMDVNYYLEQLNQRTGATMEAINNASNGSRAVALPSILAAHYTAQIAKGNLARQAEEYNQAQREKVETFNRGTNQYNSEMGLKAAMANQAARQAANNARLQGMTHAYDMREQIDSARLQAISQALGNFGQNLINMGTENLHYNMAQLPGDRYKSTRKGKIKYVKK